MSDFGQIILESVKILLAAIAGGLIGARANDKFTRKRDKESSLNADRLALVPVLEPLITWAKKGEALGYIRFEAEQRATLLAMRFRMHLNGKKLETFNAAWETLMKTTRAEVDTRQPNHSDAEFAKMQQTILTRLEAVKQAVIDA